MKLPKPIKRILFVCYGNLCRSVLAEALMKSVRQERGLAHIEIVSAGIGALPDYPAPRRIVEVAREHGLDVSDHRSRPVAPCLLDWADIVLTMEPYMKDEIQRMWPKGNLDKVFLLGGFAPGKASSGEIDDPYGCSMDDFRRCFEEIRKSLEGLLSVLT